MTAPAAPLEPMLAKIADALPTGPGFLFEPKWDGFRAIVFRTDDGTLLQSRDLKPLNRYFPELEAALTAALPIGCVLDGEIVVVAADGLDFDALQQRVHPAASRIAKLAEETPACFVAFDLLAVDGASTMALAQGERRARLERLLAERASSSLHLTPMTRDRDEAERWLAEFEGAGLDGVVAKFESGPYQAGKRAMLKIKHVRSRWSGKKDLSWQPLKPERVCEVRYDHLQGDRFRHATTFLRWRPDKPAADCRYDQLEVTTPYALAKIFGS